MRAVIGGLCAGALWPVMSALSPWGQSVSAAERVTLTYGFVEISTSVEALRTYAESGEANSELSPYLEFLNDEQISQFRAALQTRQDVNPVEVSQFLYSSIGANILDSLGEVVTTQSRRNGAIGLRGALVLAAAEPDGFSLLGVLENFPTNNVRIDSRRAFQALNSSTQLIEDTRVAIAAIESQVSSALVASVPTVMDLAAPGEYTVTTQALTLVDSDRTESPDSTEPRSIEVDLYLPASAAPVPLVIASHGLAGDSEGFTIISEHLASHGFAVAALDHPGSDRQQFLALLNGRADEIAEPTEFTQRPLDVSFLLDELTEQNSPNGPLANQLDMEKVGMIGHSFGGYTALAVAGAQLDLAVLQANCASNELIFNAANTSMLLQCTALEAPEQFTTDLHDERIQSVMALNPITSSLFGREGFSQLAVPSLIVAGTADPIAPALLEQIRPYTWLHESVETTAELVVDDAAETLDASATSDPIAPNGHYLALIEGGSHLYEAPEIEGENVTILNGIVSPDVTLTDSYQKALSLGFVEATVAQNPDFQNVLEGRAIVQIGQQPLPLFVISSLTEAMLNPPPAVLEDADGEDTDGMEAEEMGEEMPEPAPVVQ